MAPQMTAIQVHVISSLLQKYPMFGKYMKNYDLLPEELDLLSNAKHYRIRAGLAAKVMNMLGACAEAGLEFYSSQSGILPSEATALAPKISRGENYLGFPWMVLDYPRYFKGKDAIAVRSLCWWGNSLSIALLVSGVYAHQFHPIIKTRISTIPIPDELLICVHKDPWQHHFGPENYIRPQRTDEWSAFMDESIRRNDFIKLCCRFSFSQWNQFPTFFLQTQQFYLSLLKN
jgi:hypothetical protein